MVNSTDMTCVTGEWYTIEHRVNGKWETLPIKPRKDGAVYAFPSIGYELTAHTSRHFTIHIQPDKYDFEPAVDYLRQARFDVCIIYIFSTNKSCRKYDAKLPRKIRNMQEAKQNLTIRKSGVTTWITPLSYDFLIVAYRGLLHLLKIYCYCKSASYGVMVQIRYYYDVIS